MTLDDSIDLVIFVLSLAAIGVGVGCALSVAWASVVVGGILAGSVLMERLTLRLVGGKNPGKVKADEPA